MSKCGSQTPNLALKCPDSGEYDVRLGSPSLGLHPQSPRLCLVWEVLLGFPEVLNPALGSRSTPGVPQTLQPGLHSLLGDPRACLGGGALSAALGGSKIRPERSKLISTGPELGHGCPMLNPPPTLRGPRCHVGLPNRAPGVLMDAGDGEMDGLQAGWDGQLHGGVGHCAGKWTERYTQEWVRGWAERKDGRVDGHR